ncbi:MAG: Uncharacterised protein [Cryomorphaceae bacterium]|nr:MAG: Uncharacterised protein [Cryomorphaceae bacterium]
MEPVVHLEDLVKCGVRGGGAFTLRALVQPEFIARTGVKNEIAVLQEVGVEIPIAVELPCGLWRSGGIESGLSKQDATGIGYGVGIDHGSGDFGWTVTGEILFPAGMIAENEAIIVEEIAKELAVFVDQVRMTVGKYGVVVAF